MPYNPSSDFVGLWRNISGGVEKAEMPGLDFVVQAMGRAGLIRLVNSQTAPTVNQSTTAWFKPLPSSFSGEGTLFLWDASLNMYAPATPELFHGGGSGGGDGGNGGGEGPVATTTLTFAIQQEADITGLSTTLWQVVPLTATPQINDTGWDPLSKKYTPNKAGYYAFNARCNVATGTLGAAILKNDDGIFDNVGSDVVIALYVSVAPGWASVTGFAQMNGTTDYVRLFALASSGTLKASGSAPVFSALAFP